MLRMFFLLSGSAGAISKDLALASSVHTIDFSFYFPRIYLRPNFVASNALSTSSTIIKWGSDVMSKLKRLIHRAKLSGAVTENVLLIGMPSIFPGRKSLTDVL